MLVSLLILTLLYVTVKKLWQHYSLLRKMKNIPGPRQYFFIGSLLEIILDPVELFDLARNFAKQFQGFYKFIAFNKVIFNIYNPRDLEILIASRKHHKKGFVYYFLRPWLGDGLLLSKGQKWHIRRRILNPTFHFNILNQFSVVLGDLTLKLVEGLEDKLDQTIDLNSIITQFTLAATCETAMGTSLKENDLHWMKYKNAITQLSNLMYQRFCKFPLYFDAIYRLSPFWVRQQKALEHLHGFTSEIINDRKEYIKRNKVNLKLTNIRKNKHTPMLDLLIAAKDEGIIDNAGIQEEVDTFMFEGHDTTASGLTFCLMSLANNNQVQENIFKELKVIFGDSTRRASMEDLSIMHYLECCIKESLRLYPPVPFINRIVSEDIVLSGHNIPAGTVCNIHIYDLHRRVDLFPNPELFDPDRFLHENCVGRHPYAYIPFSAGPRNCIGQRFAMLMMKSALSGILRRYMLLPVTTPADITPLADIVLRNSGPVEVIFTKRK